MKGQKGFTLVALIILVFWLTVVLSWIFNFVKLAGCDFDSPYRCEVIHAAGIIPVVAPVTVWFDTDKPKP